jgi:hypothetical protein
VVSGVAPDGNPVERTAFLSVEVQPSPSKFQVNANIIIIIGLVFLVLGLMVFAAIRIIRRIGRNKYTH